jgi:TolB protein
MTLSRTGNPEIYIREMATGRLTQLTQHWAIDTEPVWAPDGKYIYFTSDRGGKPQIYRVPPTGGKSERVTLEGDYNARASIAPDGSRIAVAHGTRNEYRIAIWDIETERFTVLTPGVLDESPSFAPNGSMVLYATREGTRGVLFAVSADGSVRQRLILSEGDVREPAWSPVIR